MEIDEYKIGDIVEVKVRNPKNNLEEWRYGEVIYKRMIKPTNEETFQPYPILIVRTTRTLCHALPAYRFIDNIPLFDGNDITFYERENDEGIINKESIRIKNQLMFNLK